MKICILGSGGVFGTNLAAYLLAQGHTVMGIGRSPKKPECFSLGVDYPYHAYHITYEWEYARREILLFNPDAIVNFAAQGEGAASFGWDNWRYYETNCVGLVRLVSDLDYRFVHIGSSEVYGSVNKPVGESAPLCPSSPYSISKAAFDQHLVAMNRVKGFPMNIIRPSNCLAEGQQLHRIVPKAAICALTGRELVLHGGGVAMKSYLHADDLSKAILTVIQKGSIGDIYNCGPDEPVSIRHIVELVAAACAVPFDSFVQVGPERMGQDGQYWLSSEKIKLLGWKQQIPLADGIKRVVDWVKKYPELFGMDTNFKMRA